MLALPPQALVTRAGVTPLEPEHLGPQARPSWAEGAGGCASPRALPDGTSARATVLDVGGGPSCRRGGLRAAEALDSHLGSMALLVGFPPPASFLRAPPPTDDSTLPRLLLQECGGVRGQRVRGRSQETRALGVSSDTSTLRDDQEQDSP